MKVKHLLGFVGMGVILVMLGAFCRMMHYSGDIFLIASGLLLKTIGFVLFVIKLFKTKDFSDFMYK